MKCEHGVSANDGRYKGVWAAPLTSTWVTTHRTSHTLVLRVAGSMKSMET